MGVEYKGIHLDDPEVQKSIIALSALSSERVLSVLQERDIGEFIVHGRKEFDLQMERLSLDVGGLYTLFYTMHRRSRELIESGEVENTEELREQLSSEFGFSEGLAFDMIILWHPGAGVSAGELRKAFLISNL